MLRTHTCGELRASHAGSEVTLCGWVASLRDHKGIFFLDLRDRYGITQVSVPGGRADLREAALSLGAETVVRVRGRVVPRPEGMRNAKRPTGEIEIEASSVEVLNPARPPAIPVNDEEPASDEQRLRHRYLDLRRPSNLRVLEGRHRIVSSVRRFFDAEGFDDVETPALVRWTPGGARNYVVPSRVHTGSFYALAESPQLFKQLLMVSGLDRYYQIVRCFRDEDLRLDRQPEFSQVDVEMSFVEEADVLDVIERMWAAVVKDATGRTVPLPLPRLPFAEAMLRYGCDKPDLRYGLEISDATDLARKSGFTVFRQAAESGGVVRGLAVPGGAALSRKEIEGLEKVARESGAKGLAWMKREASGGAEEWKGPFVKFLGDGEAAALADRVGVKAGDAGLWVAADEDTACASLAAVRAACDEAGFTPTEGTGGAAAGGDGGGEEGGGEVFAGGEDTIQLPVRSARCEVRAGLRTSHSLGQGEQTVGRLPDRGHDHDDVVSGVLEQSPEPLTKQYLILGDHDPHGNSAVRVVPAPWLLSMRSVPP